MIPNSIGCVVVNYNTPKIISRAVNSIKDHVDNIIIIDGSTKGNKSFLECDNLMKNNKNVLTIHTEKNIYHGPGLNKGIDSLDNEYIICLDSDAVLRDIKLIKEMKDILLDDNVYGCGFVINVDDAGDTVNDKNSTPYLHPYFCMFKLSIYKKYSGFINHGAPFMRTMKQIKGKMKLVGIKNILERCWHEHRRTINIIGQGNWENEWVKP
jgi:GT2 family glycosyltransferase